jgi:hypothetical protein
MTADEPGIATQAPQSAEITAYDEAHIVTYMRLLDASAAGISEDEMCRLILGIDPAKGARTRKLCPKEPSCPRSLDDQRRLSPTPEGLCKLGTCCFVAPRLFGRSRSISPYAVRHDSTETTRWISAPAGDMLAEGQRGSPLTWEPRGAVVSAG